MVSDIKQDTNNLIKSLSDDLTEVKPVAHPLKQALSWAFVAIIYVAIIVYYLGVRADFLNKLHDPMYIFELSYVMAISISADICLFWLCIPDMREQKWMLAVPLSLFAGFVTWIMLKSTLYAHNTFAFHWGHCHEDAVLLGFLPAIIILFLSIKGKTTHPNLSALMSTLSVGALGYLALRITCSSDDICHLCVYHILPYLLFGIFLALFAKRIYRW